ncbi:hypothetical protein PV328_001422 [Microctonus aethiopoides]|uniref:HEAT repeat-containing protein 1 n=1 Tax=Microctonus aethiopoides TaxID=144406 RepID=A0AA39FWX1_9HYME|nr:hypothetical protein PV328_001422 [Microctonus aethiopoides]
MTTSLAEQLQKLRKPQTTLLLQDKKRPSLLFSPKEAANLDRETVFNIGNSGLEDLIKLSNAFKEFESNLFASSSVGLERSMHDVNTNKKIDIAIERFLISLAPYFLLNSAHKALEWLIYRYHIHEFNKDKFLMLILPYHETRMFVRALQLIDLTNKGDKWLWLEPLQKSGVPLSSVTLVNRVASDNGLLKLLCTHVMKATVTMTEMHDGQHSYVGALSSLYAFYTMAIVGAIERVPKISQVQIDHLLPTIAKGMSSPVVDFATSNCMILAKLSHHVQLNTHTMEHLLSKALKNPQLQNQIMLLMTFLYESPYNRPFASTVPKKLLLIISQLSPSFLCKEINRMQNSLQINVSKFVIPLFESSIDYILDCSSYDDDQDNYDDDKSQVEGIKNMIKEILQQIVFQNDDIDIILNNTLKRSNIMKNLSRVTKDLFMELYGAIELKYPERFDEYLKTLMKRSGTNIEAKEALQFLISCGHCGVKNIKGSLGVLDGLNHYNAEQRIIALEALSNNVDEIMDDISESFQVMVKEVLLERLNDDDVRVVKMVLERFSLKSLKSLFSTDILIDRLMRLLSQCHTIRKRLLAQPVLKLLLELCKEGDYHVDDDSDTNIFIATLPYLFPSHNDEVNVAIYILQSEFAKKNKYLATLKDDVMGNVPTLLDAESIGSAAFHNILNWELLPPTKNILNVMRESFNKSGGGDATALFFNLILLGSVCRVPVGSLEPQVAHQVIQMAAKIINQYRRVKILANCNQLNGNKIQDALQLTSKGILPLQAGTYVLEMVHRRLNLQSNSILDFENDSEYAQLIVGLLDILFDGMKSQKHREHYSWCLQIFFQRHCPTSQDMLRFLAQFFIKPVKAETSLHCLRIALAVLKNEYNNTDKMIEWIFQNEIFIVNLLVALSRVNRKCREAAVDILMQITSTDLSNGNACFCLLSKLSEKRTDMIMDADQLSIILYTLLSPDPDVRHQMKKKVRGKLQEAREFLMNIILNDKMPIHATSQLLNVLVYVNGPMIVEQLTCGIGYKLLSELNDTDNTSMDKLFTKIMLKNILERINSTTVDALMVDGVWKLFDSAITNYNIKIPIETEGEKLIQTQVSPSVILLRQIDELFFENCGHSSNLQAKILAKLVDIVTDCEVGSIVTIAIKATRKIIIDARLVVDELRKMSVNELASKPTGSKKKNKSLVQRRSGEMEMINRREWKRGITILEFIQAAENIVHEEYLMKLLFDLLRMSLAECDTEPSPSVEYANQLVLSIIYHLTAKNLPIPDAHEQVELISQCIRMSHNPQTHHHALVVLVELFKVAHIDMALHNIMPIFTFMGNSVLRQDDAYSIQIISKIIETVVPTILNMNSEIHACTILRTFIVSLPDIPEHRRIPLFVKLLELMDDNLYLFYLIMFECHVKITQQGYQKDIDSSLSLDRLKFALTISLEFPPDVLIHVCVKLLEFLRSLPVEIDENNGKKYTDSKKHIFDITNSTPKQLRHYKYTIIQFLSNLVSNSDFINRVAILDVDKTNQMVPYYNELFIQLIMMIESASKSADVHQGKPKGKYWRVLVNNLYDILNRINYLLPNSVFIMSIKTLINPNKMVMIVRRKAIDLMNIRLQQRKFDGDDRDQLLVLIQPLLEVIMKNKNDNGEEIVNQELEIQQTLVVTLTLLAKNWANEYPDKFQPVLAGFTAKLVEIKDEPLLGSIVLGVAELCGTMRTHAIKYINKFVPAIIKMLRCHCDNGKSLPTSSSSSSVFITSVVTALQKIVESMSSFLSLYLNELLLELCRASCMYNIDHLNVNENEKNTKISNVVARIQATALRLSCSVPMRVLLPAVEKTYHILMEMRLCRCIGPLMGIFSESFNHITGHDVELAIGDIGQLFLQVLQFREVMKNEVSNTNGDEIDSNIITEIEDRVGKAVVSFVLKLSEATFRPFYYKLYDWAARNDGMHKERCITFYRLSLNIAECLKSLFVLFAGHFLNHAALLLSNNMATHNVDQHMENGIDTEYRIEQESNRIELIDAILMTFYKVFSYDAHHFVEKERFEILAGPIVDQIENIIGSIDDHERRAQELIIPCISAFVSAIQDDSLHKQLVYQTLLKTRHANPVVRRAGLGALLGIARKLGEDFMPLLSETIPFIAEMLEDEDEITEKTAQNTVRELEEILGEPLQKYF